MENFLRRLFMSVISILVLGLSSGIMLIVLPGFASIGSKASVWQLIPISLVIFLLSNAIVYFVSGLFIPQATGRKLAKERLDGSMETVQEERKRKSLLAVVVNILFFTFLCSLLHDLLTWSKITTTIRSAFSSVVFIKKGSSAWYLVPALVTLGFYAILHLSWIISGGYGDQGMD